jgi:hypothetical protein
MSMLASLIRGNRQGNLIHVNIPAHRPKHVEKESTEFIFTGMVECDAR